MIHSFYLFYYKINHTGLFETWPFLSIHCTQIWQANVDFDCDVIFFLSKNYYGKFQTSLMSESPMAAAPQPFPLPSISYSSLVSFIPKQEPEGSQT